MALQQGLYGVVRVRVELDPTGAVRDAVVVSAPSGILKSESLRSARASTFAPARRHCTHVASVYEFRVLYAEDGPRGPSRQGPSPSPSPTPMPKPDLGKPWTLLWSTGGSYSFMDRTVTSAGTYAQLYDTFPISHRAECSDTLAASALGRVTDALRAARPESWRGDYRLALAPTPSPTTAPTPRPAVDVVAVVRGGVFFPGVMDGPTGHVTLTTTGLTYGFGYEYGVTPGIRETIPPEIRELMRSLEAATPERCARR